MTLPFRTIPHRNKLAAIRYEYILPNNQKRYGYITENKIINEKETELSNHINIILLENPKKDMIYRTTKGLFLNDGSLKILSTFKTKSNLHDYTRDLVFEDVYEKNN